MCQNSRTLAPGVYRDFRIEVRPSPDTNDHEVRFFGDSLDIISSFWTDMIGLDPDDILLAPCPIAPTDGTHRVTVARCSCGVVGCGSIEVEISRSLDYVEWKWANRDSPLSIRFLAASYHKELARSLADTSWETPDRTAARLLSNAVDREALSQHGLTFNWASGRVRQEKFSVAMTLEPGPYQVLVHVSWIDESADEIARKSVELLKMDPKEWAGVEWFPQQSNLHAPLLSGLGWRQGGR
jgi:hypothetical protein